MLYEHEARKSYGLFNILGSFYSLSKFSTKIRRGSFYYCLRKVSSYYEPGVWTGSLVHFWGLERLFLLLMVLFSDVIL